MNIVFKINRLITLTIVLLLLASCAGPANILVSTTGTPGGVQPNSTTSSLLHTPPASGTNVPLATLQSAPPSPAGTIASTRAQSANGNSIKTVFIIVMENHNWSQIKDNPLAPYINKTLLPQASYAQQYFNPPGNHPSLPNYLWLEAGTNFGIKNDESPASNHQSSTDHLVTLLNKAGITWKAYEEGISGKVCPLTDKGQYAAKHNPMVYFDDVTENNNPNSTVCIAHERPYTELQSDVQNNKVAQYNFITPNLCHNMHDTDGCQTTDAVANGDTWLSEQIPMILGSSAYQQGGVLFIVWDESENGDNPVGMIVLSPFAKGGGYSNSIHYTHSSTLRTIQEIFNVTPFLGDAANATDLSDLFKKFP